MTAETISTAVSNPVARAFRSTALLMVIGGVLTAVGGQLHPHGSGETVDEHLLSMFADPMWTLAHVISLAAAIINVVALIQARRHAVFGPTVQRFLPIVILAWTFGAVEQVPHLLAAGEAHALEHHAATPVLDLHVMLQVIATPAVGLGGAWLSVVVARTRRTVGGWVLAGLAVITGLLYAVSAPLVVLTGNTGATLLFPFQAGLAIWLVATGIALGRHRSVSQLPGAHV